MRLARASPTARSGRGVSWDPRIHNGHPQFVLLGCSFSFFFLHLEISAWRQIFWPRLRHSLFLMALCWGVEDLLGKDWPLVCSRNQMKNSRLIRVIPEVDEQWTNRSFRLMHSYPKLIFLSDLFACVLKTQLLVVPVLRLYQSWLIFAPVNEEAWHQSALKPKVRPIIPKKRLGQTRPRPLLGFCDNPRCWIS